MFYKLTYITIKEIELSRMPGKIIWQSDWQIKSPAYEIKPRIKTRDSSVKQAKNLYYKDIVLDLLPKQAKLLHKKLIRNEKILRYLLVKAQQWGKNSLVKNKQVYKKEIKKARTTKPAHKKVSKMRIEELDKKLDEILNS